MRDNPSQGRDGRSRRKQNSKYSRNGKKKGRKNYNSAQSNGNRVPNGQSQAAPGVCIKCGFPAPDGKLCSFHRMLLNSIRNDFGKQASRGFPSGVSPQEM